MTSVIATYGRYIGIIGGTPKLAFGDMGFEHWKCPLDYAIAISEITGNKILVPNIWQSQIYGSNNKYAYSIDGGLTWKSGTVPISPTNIVYRNDTVVLYSTAAHKYCVYKDNSFSTPLTLENNTLITVDAAGRFVMVTKKASTTGKVTRHYVHVKVSANADFSSPDYEVDSFGTVASGSITMISTPCNMTSLEYDSSITNSGNIGSILLKFDNNELYVLDNYNSSSQQEGYFTHKLGNSTSSDGITTLAKDLSDLTVLISITNPIVAYTNGYEIIGICSDISKSYKISGAGEYSAHKLEKHIDYYTGVTKDKVCVLDRDHIFVNGVCINNYLNNSGEILADISEGVRSILDKYNSAYDSAITSALYTKIREIENRLSALGG